MKHLCLLVLCLVVVLEAVHVTVYYESLCSDSVNFITRQLFPNYEFFKDHLTIDFVPYGKASHIFNKTTSKYTFNCQHGREECKGNKFQACGLAQIDGQEKQLEFVTCVMSAENPSNPYFIELCAKKYQLDFTKITTCVVSRDGDKLLAAHGDKTWNLEPNLYFVPTVVFNNSNQIESDDQEKSLSDFKTILCRKITENKPEICNEIGIFDRIKRLFS